MDVKLSRLSLCGIAALSAQGNYPTAGQEEGRNFKAKGSREALDTGAIGNSQKTFVTLQLIKWPLKKQVRLGKNEATNPAANKMTFKKASD